MGIEKEIQTLNFRNEYQKVGVNIIFTANWFTERFKQILDVYDITNQQFNILRILRGSKRPLSTLQIRDRMLDKMSDTSRIVDRLVKKELVEKTVCEADKRLVDIRITDKGLALLMEMDNRNEDTDNLLKGLNPQEAEQLNHLLDKLRDIQL
ncbi:MAG: MarR family transcriptional regulator [Chitinophagaceae bacterium BSSC1]|nr:MAG: MarR family transcriptional regulator [Chitinophagaceae bacterium BSSC1]